LAWIGETAGLAGQYAPGYYSSRRMVVGFEEGFSLVSLDSLLNHGNQPMDWYSNNPWKLYRIDPSTNPHIGDALRKMAAWRGLGGSTIVCHHIYLGMVIVLVKYYQQPASYAVKFDHSIPDGAARWPVLGALVGN
jgi:hypothetical protein